MDFRNSAKQEARALFHGQGGHSSANELIIHHARTVAHTVNLSVTAVLYAMLQGGMPARQKTIASTLVVPAPSPRHERTGRGPGFRDVATGVPSASRCIQAQVPSIAPNKVVVVLVEYQSLQGNSDSEQG
jgi:hypothetical protein